MRPEPPISVLDFHPPGDGDVPFEIGRLETTHRLGTSAWPHRHRFYQVIWATDGAGVQTIDFEEHAIRPQTVFLVSPGQVHAVRIDRPLAGYMLVFTAEFLAVGAIGAVGGSSPDQTGAPAGVPFSRPGVGVPVLTLREAEAHHLRGIAEDLLLEFTSSEPWRREMLRARFQTLLLALGRIALRHDARLAPPASSVSRFQALIEEQFRQLHQVADYARLLGLTPGHLNDLAKAATGQTASALIDTRLILEAKRLLAHSDAPAAEIAAELGFSDPSYFGRFFRRHAAQSPGAFRAAIRETYQSDR